MRTCRMRLPRSSFPLRLRRTQKGGWILDDLTPLHQIDEATRRGNENIDTATERLCLWSLPDPSEDDRVADVEMPEPASF